MLPALARALGARRDRPFIRTFSSLIALWSPSIGNLFGD